MSPRSVITPTVRFSPTPPVGPTVTLRLLVPASVISAKSALSKPQRRQDHTPRTDMLSAEMSVSVIFLGTGGDVRPMGLVLGLAAD